MKKWILLILSFLIKPLAQKGGTVHPIEELKEFLRENAMKLVVGLTLIIAMGTMLTAGLTMIVFNLANQFDSPQFIHMTSVIEGGILLCLVSILFIGVCSFLSTPQGAPQKKPIMNKNQAGSPIEEAIVLLIHDFVKEREANRVARKERAEEHRREEEREERRAAEYGSDYRSSEEFERH